MVHPLPAHTCVHTPCPSHTRARTQADSDAGLEEPGPKKPRTAAEVANSSADEMTSKDYYFDSYSHFGNAHAGSTAPAWLVSSAC